MARPAAAIETSWLRVEGPRDEAACAWCRRWAGRILPREFGASYQEEHRRAGSTHACRCKLEPERLRLDPEDPGCQWA